MSLQPPLLHASTPTRYTSLIAGQGDTGILAEAGRLVTSKAARRAALNASLLVGFLVGLFCAAGVASWVFYNNYLPDQIVTLPIHLQYG